MAAIAVLGHGVVGSGVVEALRLGRESIARKTGEEIWVKRILDIREFPGLSYADKFTKDFGDIVADPEIQVVVEAMGGIKPAYEYNKSALLAGKSVVTSNKELVAVKGAELLTLARQNNVNFLFEASVGSCIPIIRPMHRNLSGDRIEEIAGILNGTTNFILTRMIREDMSFDDALRMAQELGYAEADPAADVEGLDACRKICILASLAFGSHVYPDKVHTEGITAVTREDVQYAEDAGCVVKLLGHTRRGGDKFFVAVGPCLVPRESLISNVDDVFNAILVRGEITGDLVFYGRGAGKLPTASAVIGDVIDCITAGGTIASQYWEDSDGDNVQDYRCASFPRYVRCRGRGLFEKIAAVFGEVRLLRRPEKPGDEEAFILRPVDGFALQEKLDAFEKRGAEILNCMRVFS